MSGRTYFVNRSDCHKSTTRRRRRRRNTIYVEYQMQSRLNRLMEKTFLKFFYCYY